MKDELDRVAFCRYLFTRCIFVEETKVVCGNPTMFTTYEGATKLADELFFKAIDLQAIAHERDVPDRPSLFETIICLTHETVSKFRDLVKGGKIICSFETQFIDPKDLTFAKKIKDLNPYGIDWSNVSDYTRKWDFIKFARA